MMNDEETQIWYYDINNGNKYLSTKLVDTNHQLKAGETFIQPKDGLLWPIYFSIEKQEWIGTPKKDWVNPRQEPLPGPTPQQKALAGVMKDLASVKTDGQNQDKLNANVMKQVAQLAIQNTAQAKLNANVMKQMAQMKISTDTKLKEQEQVNANAMKEIAMLKISLAKAAQPTQPTESTQPTEPAKPSEPTAPAQPTEVTQPTDTKEEA